MQDFLEKTCVGTHGPTAAGDIAHNIFVCRLALERCQQHLSHLHALLHFCMPEQDVTAKRVPCDAIRTLIMRLQDELAYSADALEEPC